MAEQRLEAPEVPFAPRRRLAWRAGLGLGVRPAEVQRNGRIRG